MIIIIVITVIIIIIIIIISSSSSSSSGGSSSSISLRTDRYQFFGTWPVSLAVVTWDDVLIKCTAMLPKCPPSFRTGLLVES